MAWKRPDTAGDGGHLSAWTASGSRKIPRGSGAGHRYLARNATGGGCDPISISRTHGNSPQQRPPRRVRVIFYIDAGVAPGAPAQAGLVRQARAGRDQNLAQGLLDLVTLGSVADVRAAQCQQPGSTRTSRLSAPRQLVRCLEGSRAALGSPPAWNSSSVAPERGVGSSEP